MTKNNILFRSIAKLKPWYYFFTFLISIVYAAVNDGDKVYHWRYLIAYALFAMFLISYIVRYKREMQNISTTKPANTIEKSKDLGLKVVSLALQIAYGWMLCFVYVGALNAIGDETFGRGIVIALIIMLLIVVLQSTVQLSSYSRLFADMRRSVYWISTSVLLLLILVLSNISLYGPSRYSGKEMLISLAITLPFQIIGYFAMKVKVIDPAVQDIKKV